MTKEVPHIDTDSGKQPVYIYIYIYIYKYRIYIYIYIDTQT